MTTLFKAPNITAIGLSDSFGRDVTYLRLSVTDRCDLRCTYCMADNMVFLPKRDLLALEELDQVATTFIEKGVRKLRITGGEPLVRRNIVELIEALSRHLKSGRLEELTLTTNATQLSKHAKRLAEAGVKRINVSLDSLDPENYRRITRGGTLQAALDGIEAAQRHGLSVKINCVALKKDNAHEIKHMIEWAHQKSMDFTLIETMPMGEINEDRFNQYLSLSNLKSELQNNWTLTPSLHRTGGPARFYNIKETGGRLGLITPLSQKFCESCNRVRVTATGKLFLCLGQNASADLRTALREGGADSLSNTIDEAIGRKPEAHDFEITEKKQAPTVGRHMSMTGG